MHARRPITVTLAVIVLAAAAAFAAAVPPPAAAADYPPQPGDLLWMQTWHPSSTFMKYAGIDVVRGPGGDLWLGVGGSTSATDSPYVKRMCVARYSPGGVRRWGKVVPSPVYMTMYAGLAVDRQRNAIVVGTKIDYEGPSFNPWVIAKLSPSGTRLWTRDCPNPIENTNAAVAAVAVDSQGGIYVAGTMRRTATGDDVMLTKYSPTGARKWTRYITGYEASADLGIDVAVDAKDRVYVVGTTGGFFSGTDITFAQYTIAGKLVGQLTWDGDGHDDAATDLTVTPYNLAIAGSSDGADGRPRGVMLLSEPDIQDHLIAETVTPVPGYNLTWTSVAMNTSGGDIAAGGVLTGGVNSEFAYGTWSGGGAAVATFYPSPAGSASCADIAVTSTGTVVGVGTFLDTNDLHVMSDPKTGSGWRTTVGLPSREVGTSVVVTSGGVYSTGECGNQIGLWKFQP